MRAALGNEEHKTITQIYNESNDGINPTWIAYKVREEYPTTQTVYWTQKLDGPFKDSVELEEALKNLSTVKRENRDVKDIRTLIEG